MQLGEIAKANPEVAIGSYPFFDPQHGPNTNVVLRARDAQKLALAKCAVEDMLAPPSVAKEIENEYGKTALEGLQKIGFKFEDEPAMP
jgi:hypothetical protein